MTNLRSHLRVNHPSVFAERGSSTPASGGGTTSGQQRLSEAFARGEKYQRDSNQWRVLTDSVTRYLVEEMVPFRTVEKPAFKAMLQAFDKQYVRLDQKYFSQTAIPAMCLTMKDGIIRDLKDVDHFSATADMWSSVNMMPYMSLTIHYLSAHWELKSKCLETVFMSESHTGDNVAEAHRSSLQDWSLDKRKLGWQRLSCFGHNLHLAVTNALKTEKHRTARAMGLCRLLVTTFSQSWQKKRKLQKEQTELNLPQQCLVLDIEVLESVNVALKKVADFTDALSSEKTVTASSVKPVLQLLCEDLLMRNLKIKMTGVLEDKYNAPATQRLLAKASFVDPRYKDINRVDDVKDALLGEMLAVPEERCDDGDGAMRAPMAGEGEGARAGALAPSPSPAIGARMAPSPSSQRSSGTASISSNSASLTKK
ncbi:hypothetical protein SRHO_G00251260 [Serrasalmus rhombeus]